MTVIDDTDAEVRHLHAGDSGSADEARDETPETEATAAPPEDTPELDGVPEEPPYVTAFVITIDAAGNAAAWVDINHLSGRVIMRQATFADFKRACSQIADDVLEMGVTERVLTSLSQFMPQFIAKGLEQFGAQMANQAITQKVAPGSGGAHLLG